MGNYLDVRRIVESVDQRKKTSVLNFDSIPTESETSRFIMNGVMFDKLLLECDEVDCMPKHASYDNCEASVRNKEIYLDESLLDNIILLDVTDQSVEVFELVTEAPIVSFYAPFKVTKGAM